MSLMGRGRNFQIDLNFHSPVPFSVVRKPFDSNLFTILSIGALILILPPGILTIFPSLFLVNIEPELDVFLSIIVPRKFARPVLVFVIKVFSSDNSNPRVSSLLFA